MVQVRVLRSAWRPGLLALDMVLALILVLALMLVEEGPGKLGWFTRGCCLQLSYLWVRDLDLGLGRIDVDALGVLRVGRGTLFDGVEDVLGAAFVLDFWRGEMGLLLEGPARDYHVLDVGGVLVVTETVEVVFLVVDLDERDLLDLAGLAFYSEADGDDVALLRLLRGFGRRFEVFAVVDAVAGALLGREEVGAGELGLPDKFEVVLRAEGDELAVAVVEFLVDLFLDAVLLLELSLVDVEGAHGVGLKGGGRLRWRGGGLGQHWLEELVVDFVEQLFEVVLAVFLVPILAVVARLDLVEVLRAGFRDEALLHGLLGVVLLLLESQLVGAHVPVLLVDTLDDLLAYMLFEGGDVARLELELEGALQLLLEALAEDSVENLLRAVQEVAAAVGEVELPPFFAELLDCDDLVFLLILEGLLLGEALGVVLSSVFGALPGLRFAGTVGELENWVFLVCGEVELTEEEFTVLFIEAVLNDALLGVAELLLLGDDLLDGLNHLVVDEEEAEEDVRIESVEDALA